jgi:hypothetical protein
LINIVFLLKSANDWPAGSLGPVPHRRNRDEFDQAAGIVEFHLAAAALGISPFTHAWGASEAVA